MVGSSTSVPTSTLGLISNISALLFMILKYKWLALNFKHYSFIFFLIENSHFLGKRRFSIFINFLIETIIIMGRRLQ